MRTGQSKKNPQIDKKKIGGRLSTVSVSDHEGPRIYTVTI